MPSRDLVCAMEKRFRVNFIREKKSVLTLPGFSLMDLMRREGIRVEAPCGGHGTCGKCTVSIDGGRQVLACQHYPAEDTTVDTRIDTAVNARIDSDVNPRTDPSHMQTSASVTQHPAGQNPAAEGNRSARFLAAFDIGTTTVAGYLIRKDDGTVAVSSSCTNPQVRYGADVISRISESVTHGSGPLTECIRHAVNDLLSEMTAQAGAGPSDVTALSIVGNPCMQHLFLGITPSSLAHAPYEPAVTGPLIQEAAALGLKAHPQAAVYFPPNISGFVGGDTIACLTANHMEDLPGWTLLVDIGTNGEVVLGCGSRLYACSAAAGPAFEGAGISCGMRGTEGAVSHAKWKKGKWVLETVGDARPSGICGSGLLDIAAQLLLSGQMDERGTLPGGMPVVIASEQESAGGKRIELTQKDIRQLQLAKAAICAAIRLTAAQAGIRPEQISRVWLAGAFGSFLSPQSACAIGLIPPVLSGRIRSIGNAAGAGARLLVMNPDDREYAQDIALRTEHIELASLPQFQDEFVDAMDFPMPQ